jgi:lipopolysaccharide/colanic/teichoic acid biosynthesis glycosyltransferase
VVTRRRLLPIDHARLRTAPPPPPRALDVSGLTSYQARVRLPAQVVAGSRFYEAAKRSLDFGIALAAVTVLLPLMLAIAVLIKLDSPGPVFYASRRLGKHGREFSMLKFRSMHTGRSDLNADLQRLNEASGPLFKMRRDPRITRIGRVLRRTSLDELPQLFNVLTGQMSIVGPRPPLPRELAGFEEVQLRRLRVAPGLTGLWQVSGRSDLPFEEMVRLDLEYIASRSLLLDLLIVLRTVPSVVAGRGAY